MGVGQWELQLREDTPRSILAQLRVDLPGVGFSNIVITHAPFDDVDSVADADFLRMARYAGVYRRQPDELTLNGAGAAVYISDEDDKGPSYAGGLSTAAGTFAQWAAALKPGWMPTGIVSAIAGTFPKTYGPTTLKKPLQEVADAFGAEWRISTDFKFDFGRPQDLFRLDPTAIMVRRQGDGGRDTELTGIVGELDVKRDLEDWTRRIAYVTGTDEAPVVTTADGGVAAIDVPYRAGNGSALTMDRYIDGSNTEQGSAASLAAAQYGRFSVTHQEMALKTGEYDVQQSFDVGDNILVYDPLRGIYDTANAYTYRGQLIQPEIIRCVGLTWPIRRGAGVYLRHWVRGTSDWAVRYLDLTPYVDWEDGDTTVELGAKPRRS